MTKILLDENGKIMTNGKMIYTGSDGGSKLYRHNITYAIEDGVDYYEVYIEIITSNATEITTPAELYKISLYYIGMSVYRNTTTNVIKKGYGVLNIIPYSTYIDMDSTFSYGSTSSKTYLMSKTTHTIFDTVTEL